MALLIAHDGDGRARARLDGREDGIGVVEAAKLAVKCRDAGAQRFGYMLGQAWVDFGPGDAERIGGRDAGGRLAGSACEEVSDELCRGAIGAAAELESAHLAAALKLDSGQRVFAGKVARVDVYQKRCVGVEAVSRVKARAVGDHTAWLRGGGDNLASGAHAEREEASATRKMGDELVGCGPQSGMPGRAAVLGAVDIALQMLDTYTHGKGLAGKGEAAAIEKREHIAR